MLDVEIEREQAERREKLLRGERPSAGAWCVENRLEQARELYAQKEKKEDYERKRMGTDKKPPREIPGVLNHKGEIRQCNEGKYDFKIDDDSQVGMVIFELGVPKYMDTASLDVDVNPWYVRCVVKEKLSQLKLPLEVAPSKAVVQRSKTTGWLKVTMPVANASDIKPRFEKKPDPPKIQPLDAQHGPNDENAAGNLKGSVTLDIYRGRGELAPAKQKPLLKARGQAAAAAGVAAPAPTEVTAAVRAALEAEGLTEDDVPPLEIIQK